MSGAFRANSRMLRTLQRLEREGSRRNGLHPELDALVDNGFVECYGCIFLSGFEKSARPNGTKKSLVDKTGLECFANHLHIKDYVKSDPAEQLRQGMMFAQKLAEALRLSFPRTRFRIIVAQNAQGVIVRFHKLRPNEEWLSSDLEAYKDDSIGIITVSAGVALLTRARRF